MISPLLIIRYKPDAKAEASALASNLNPLEVPLHPIGWSGNALGELFALDGNLLRLFVGLDHGEFPHRQQRDDHSVDHIHDDLPTGQAGIQRFGSIGTAVAGGVQDVLAGLTGSDEGCLLYTSPSPRDS